jgi:hypothetical protein
MSIAKISEVSRSDVILAGVCAPGENCKVVSVIQAPLAEKSIPARIWDCQ